MCRSSMIVLVATCLLALSGGASAVFQAIGSGPTQSPPVITGANFDVYVILDEGASQGTVMVKLYNVTNYQACILTIAGVSMNSTEMTSNSTSNSTDSGNSTSATSMPVPIMWIDPISAMLVPSPAQNKNIGEASFVTTFTADNLIGPMANMTIDTLYQAMVAGNVTFCVVTGDAPTGLIAQQIAPVSEMFSTTLMSENEMDPNVTSPSGMMAYGISMLTFSPDYSTCDVTLTLYSVTGYTMSHIHMGNASTSSPVAVWINPSSPDQYNMAALGSNNIGTSSFLLTFNVTNLVGYMMTNSTNGTVMDNNGTANGTVTDNGGSTNGTVTNNGGSTNGTVTNNGGASNGTVTDNGGATNGTVTDNGGVSNGTVTDNGGAMNGTTPSDAGMPGQRRRLLMRVRKLMESSSNLLSLAQAARSGDLYADAHTMAYPAGVCRGQYVSKMK